MGVGGLVEKRVVESEEADPYMEPEGGAREGELMVEVGGEWVEVEEARVGARGTVDKGMRQVKERALE